MKLRRPIALDRSRSFSSCVLNFTRLQLFVTFTAGARLSSPAIVYCFRWLIACEYLPSPQKVQGTTNQETYSPCQTVSTGSGKRPGLNPRHGRGCQDNKPGRYRSGTDLITQDPQRRREILCTQDKFKTLLAKPVGKVKKHSRLVRIGTPSAQKAPRKLVCCWQRI